MAGKKSSSSSSASHGLLPWLGIAVIIILLDQFTKTLIVGYFQLGDSREVFSFFNVVRVHNHGAAFSMLATAGGWQRWFFIGLGFVAVGFMLYMLRQHGGQRLFAWALTLIIGGALGNVIDRLIHGYDQIDHDILWNILTQDLPPLVPVLEDILSKP